MTGMVYFLCHATVPFESLVSIEFWCRSSSMLTRGKFASSWTSPLQRRNGPFLSHHLLSRVVGEEMGAQIICPTFFGGVICHVSAQSLHLWSYTTLLQFADFALSASGGGLPLFTDELLYVVVDNQIPHTYRQPIVVGHRDGCFRFSGVQASTCASP